MYNNKKRKLNLKRINTFLLTNVVYKFYYIF